ncbi:MAG TPA: helix-turn-helix transcriptional regulator [Candidatus Saccharimonadales bacterium]|nr:helix-turn-helix transcriptional regulator [Candidatus Saccharimonadales bacterium]
MNMNKTSSILRDFRSRTGWSATEAAKRLSITPQYLSRCETGSQIPSSELLEKMIRAYSIPLEDAIMLRDAAGYEQRPTNLVPSPTSSQNMQVMLDEAAVPVLFSDVVLVTSDPHGIIISAGQKNFADQIHIVSRTGLSLEHAEKLYAVLAMHISNLKKNI